MVNRCEELYERLTDVPISELGPVLFLYRPLPMNCMSEKQCWLNVFYPRVDLYLRRLISTVGTSQHLARYLINVFIGEIQYSQNVG